MAIDVALKYTLCCYYHLQCYTIVISFNIVASIIAVTLLLASNWYCWTMHCWLLLELQF